MANVERLTKRVKKMEEWIAENEDVGGPAGTLETFNFLVSEVRRIGMAAENANNRFQELRRITFAFVAEKELEKEWDTFIEERENAVQEQQAEEVSVQEQAESSEEVSETPEEKKE